MAETIKIRARINQGVAEVRTLIRHPMTVTRVNPDSGEVTPGHFIREVVCSHNDKQVMRCHWGQGVSRNPYLSFHVENAAEGDRLTISWTDNQGASDSQSITL